MPIEKIIPDAVTTPHPAWTANPHEQLDADDTNYAVCATTGASFVISFSNLTGNIDTINSIRFYIRGATAVVSFDLYDSAESTNFYDETKNFDDTTTNTVQAGTERTTTDGSTAWTESDVNGLRMKVVYVSNTNASSNINLDHLYINVDYNEPSTPTYDTTIGRIIVNSGTITLNEGTIILD
jgi:hypothetical protein